MLEYRGKLALVTGASSGIGYSIAKELVARGATVIAVARRVERLRELETTCPPGSIELLVADLCNRDDLKRITDTIDSRNIQVVVNNAGRGSFGVFDKLPIESELEMIELNVVAFTSITHAALNSFRKQGAGAILGVSSIAAFQPLPYLATYAATKAFEFHLFDALRAEVRERSITLTSLNPGPVATEFAGVARVPGTVTGFNRDDVKMVARKALDALARGDRYIVPGFSSYMMAFASQWLPRWITVNAVAKSLGPVLARSKLNS